jgi:hypothetical protein
VKQPKHKPSLLPSPPWADDGNVHLWVTVGKFALLMNRRESTIYNWLRDGTLKKFGYSIYRDLKGVHFIRISEENRAGLDRILTKIRTISP